MWAATTNQIKLNGQMQPLPEPPPTAVEPPHCTHRSIETLVVVLAAITILGVIAGFFARLCGGKHSDGDRAEGWVEQRCKSCIDGGLPTPPRPPEEAKKKGPSGEPTPTKMINVGSIPDALYFRSAKK